MSRPNRPDWLISYNARAYYDGRRSRDEYLRRKNEEQVFLFVTQLGTVGIMAMCPPLGVGVGLATSALLALDEYLIAPRYDSNTDVVIEDIEVVFANRNQVLMTGDRYVDIELELTEALVELAETDSNVQYQLDWR